MKTTRPVPPPARRRRAAKLPPILPAPIRADRLAGHFAVSDAVPIVLRGRATPADYESARALATYVAATTKMSLPIESHRESRGLGAHIALHSDAELTDAPAECAQNHEAYRIAVSPQAIDVLAGSAAGLRWGIETLCQLLDPKGRVPACLIDDAPAFPMRGVMLDISRGKVPTAKTLREIVDLLVRLKLNVLMLYTEHTFRFRRHPQIGAGDSPIDAQTLRDLDTYAAARGVELIPCLQSLGHMEHILKLPRYASLAETDAGWTISPAMPETYELLGDLYDEYLPNFRSSWLNANCDEAWDLGRGKSAARSHELGPGGLYLEHVNRIRELAAANGKRTMIWGDAVHTHPERIPEIDPDLMLLDWWYEADFDFDRVRIFAEHGIEFLVCPGTSTWNSLFPRVENSRLNIERWVEAGRRHGAKGVLNTDWGDFGHYNLQGYSWFAYAWGAQQSWSGSVTDRDFDRAFSRLLFGDPSGEVARIYRALGAIHDPGFSMFNGSAIQYLYFDELERSYFIGATRRGALARCERRLEKVRARIAAGEPKFGLRTRTFDEFVYAADASLLAVRKAQAGRAYTVWRRNPDGLGAPERRRLANTLASLANEQRELAKRFRRLWLARSTVSNLDLTERRLRRSIRSLRAAAKNLTRNRPSPPPPSDQRISARGALRAIRESIRD